MSGLSWKDKWELLKLYHRRDEMFSKLSSRKLWMTVIGTAVLALCGQIGVSSEACGHIVTLLQTFIIGQGAVDAVKGLAAGIAAKENALTPEQIKALTQ